MDRIAKMEMAKCHILMAEYQLQNMSSSSQSNGCRPRFEIVCWHSAMAGQEDYRDCPFEFCQSCPLNGYDRQASRQCQGNGRWGPVNWDRCRFIHENASYCINRPCYPCKGVNDTDADNFKDSMQTLVLSLSLISGLLLLISLIVFSTYKSIQCTRLSIHKNLASAFLIRFASFVAWICLWMPPQPFFLGCTLSDHDYKKVEWLCKILLFLIMYSTMCSIYWMFAEGVYLVSRLSLFAFKNEVPMWPFRLLGWGIPIPLTVVWAFLMQFSSNHRICWLPYTKSKYQWILIGPMLGILFINFLLLIFIVGILIQKLTASNTQESKKLWKTIRATLILAPLLGLANLLWFHEPNRESSAYKAYLLFNGIMQHSQGIFFSVIYCFLNGEIRTVWWRKLKRTSVYQSMATHCSLQDVNSSVAVVGKRHSSNAESQLMASNGLPRRDDRHSSAVTTRLLSPEDVRLMDSTNQCKNKKRSGSYGCSKRLD